MQANSALNKSGPIILPEDLLIFFFQVRERWGKSYSFWPSLYIFLDNCILDLAMNKNFNKGCFLSGTGLRMGGTFEERIRVSTKDIVFICSRCRQIMNIFNLDEEIKSHVKVKNRKYSMFCRRTSGSFWEKPILAFSDPVIRN